MDGYDQVAEIGKALGHPVRLQILQVLREEEACVCHLEAILGQRQAYISQHLMRLREAGLVVDRREGMNVFYSLANEAIGSLLEAAIKAAVAAADERGEMLSFAPLQHNVVDVCTCPPCRAQRDGVITLPDVIIRRS